MPFWAYLVQCADRHFYAGHTDDLERRIGEHQLGTIPGYTKSRRPVHLVWSQEFPSRYEALSAERQIKGWGRAKKLALIRGDWATISSLARSTEKEGRASTSSARTEFGGGINSLFLYPHLTTLPCQPFGLEAATRFNDDRLTLRFRLTGDLGLLRIPARTTPARRGGLWQHTCFEAFLQIAAGYFEFNLSPSTEWAAFSFSGYREGMADLDVLAPVIRVKTGQRALELTATIPLPPDLHPIRLGLSAVMEEVDGTKSYWALRHPPGDKPDFHHPDCFALELPPAGGA